MSGTVFKANAESLPCQYIRMYIEQPHPHKYKGRSREVDPVFSGHWKPETGNPYSFSWNSHTEQEI
jgi:hypothetical protein